MVLPQFHSIGTNISPASSAPPHVPALHQPATCTQGTWMLMGMYTCVVPTPLGSLQAHTYVHIAVSSRPLPSLCPSLLAEACILWLWTCKIEFLLGGCTRMVSWELDATTQLNPSEHQLLYPSTMLIRLHAAGSTAYHWRLILDSFFRGAGGDQLGQVMH